MKAIQLIIVLIGGLVVPGIIYLVCIIWGIQKFIHTLRSQEGQVTQKARQKHNRRPQASPIFQTIGLYVGTLWIIGLLLVCAFILAEHWLHALERSEFLVEFIFLILPYSLMLIMILQRCMKMLAVKRQEPPLQTYVPLTLSVIGVIAGIIIFVLVQERNPLETYGVTFEWYDPADEPGKYHYIHLLRNIDGYTISGPLCGGQYPTVTFSDEDRDGIEDILIHSRHGEEIGVFGIVEPYVTHKPAFKIIRGSEETCPTPSSPPFAEYLKGHLF
jgi:uncharacterized membrane protein YidH (DUF202 family)